MQNYSQTLVGFKFLSCTEEQTGIASHIASGVPGNLFLKPELVNRDSCLSLCDAFKQFASLHKYWPTLRLRCAYFKSRRRGGGENFSENLIVIYVNTREFAA